MNLRTFVQQYGAEAAVERTVRVHEQHWHVKSFDGNRFTVIHGPLRTQGIIDERMWRRCRVIPSFEEVQSRYLRIVRALREVCLLTQTEAASAVYGLALSGLNFAGSEAVARLGGAARSVQHAFAHRHYRATR